MMFRLQLKALLVVVLCQTMLMTSNAKEQVQPANKADKRFWRGSMANAGLRDQVPAYDSGSPLLTTSHPEAKKDAKEKDKRFWRSSMAQGVNGLGDYDSAYYFDKRFWRSNFGAAQDGLNDDFDEFYGDVEPYYKKRFWRSPMANAGKSNYFYKRAVAALESASDQDIDDIEKLMKRFWKEVVAILRRRHGNENKP